MPEDEKCPFINCVGGGEILDACLTLWPPPDSPPLTLGAHRRCFDAIRDPSIKADSPRDYGSIPARARCLFCGKALPVIGKHAYVLEIDGDAHANRFWAHAGCIEKAMIVIRPNDSNAR